jgi:putative cardiolipin synthase
VPTDSGVALFTSMARRGVDIEILTNSLEATDVAAVHAGYAKRRKSLLESGIKLYELQRLSPQQEEDRVFGRLGSSSASSLHAKTFAIDGARVFVGSFNFDPRSSRLNTEMGFVIDSPPLAHQVDETFTGPIPGEAYRVQLAPDGKLVWAEQRNGVTVLHNSEPSTGWWQRFWVWLMSLLPIEALL